MKIRGKAGWLILLPFILSICWLGSILHESDQASIFYGASKLAQGEARWIHPGFYEYGNYFFSYWILAAGYILFPNADAVWLGNMISLGVFWVGALFLLSSIRLRTFASQISFFVALISPAILVHVSYFSPIFISSGFLFTGAALLARSPRNFPFSTLCWILAFGCRMDALLLIPLLAWLSAEKAKFSALISGWKSWCILAGGVLVFWVGKELNAGKELLGYSFFFHPKVYLAYLIFGASGAFGLLLMLLGYLGREGARQSGLNKRFFWWGAGVALMVPFTFYSLLMFTPRHWVLTITAQVLLLSSDKFAAIWKPRKEFMILLLAGAVFPLWIGIRLPVPTKPRLTIQHPTLFPTTDGRFPMGAVIPFMFSGERLDHNQQTWLAAREMSHWKEYKGRVPLVPFPLVDIVRLAVLCRGQESMLLGSSLSEVPFFYLSSRSLLKYPVSFDQKQTHPLDENFEDWIFEKQSGYFPVNIFRLEQSVLGEMNPWSTHKKRILFLRQMFGGNEIRWKRICPAGEFTPPISWEGRSILWFSEKPFHVFIGTNAIPSTWFKWSENEGFWRLSLSAEAREGKTMVLSHAVEVATTIYPDYMTLKNFN